MDDTKRFFRFVLPGLASVLEFLLFVSILQPYGVASFVKNRPLAGGNDLGLAVTIFMGSGSIGFILATFYHVFYWSHLLDKKLFRGFTIDHRQVLKEAEEEGVLRLVKRKSVEQQEEESSWINKASRADGWRVATGLWHARIGVSDVLKGANPRTDSLTSIVHSLGTLTVGTAIAILTSLVFFLYVDPDSPLGAPFPDVLWAWVIPVWRARRRSIPFFAVSMVMLIWQLLAFRVAVRHAQEVIDMILLQDLRSMRDSTGRAFEWPVADKREHWSKRWLKYHGRVCNRDNRPIVVLFGHDGPDDDCNKYLSRVGPWGKVQPKDGYHVDFEIYATCSVYKYVLGFRKWLPVRCHRTWEEFGNELGERGKKWIREIQEAFGSEATPPCGKRDDNAII